MVSRFRYGDFKSRNFKCNYLDNMSLTSLSSVQKFSIKDDSKNKGQCYMGICLPRVLTELFPDNQVMCRRLSFAEKNVNLESHFSFYESETNLYENKNRFARHNKKVCLKCSRVRHRENDESGKFTLSFSLKINLNVECSNI